MTPNQIRAALNGLPVIDIAERARLIPNTVFNLRNNKVNSTPETIDRVRQAIEQHQKEHHYN